MRLKKSLPKDENESRSLANYDVSNSTTVKHDCCDKSYSTKLKLQNESVTLELASKPKDYNTSDLALHLKHVSKYTPSNGDYETTHTVKFGSPTVGPLRFFTTVSFPSRYSSLKRSFIIIKKSFDSSFPRLSD